MLFTGHTTTELADILENLNEQSSQSVSAVEVIKGTHETVCDWMRTRNFMHLGTCWVNFVSGTGFIALSQTSPICRMSRISF